MAGELEGAPFTLGDLRRTIETRLAAVRQSEEARGQLQSPRPGRGTESALQQTSLL